MSLPSPSEPRQPLRRLRAALTVRALLAGAAGFAGVALLQPEAAPVAAGGFVLLAACVLWPRRIAPRAISPKRPALERRQIVLWPEAGMKAVVETMRQPALMLDRNMMLRYRNSMSERAFGSMALGDPISLRFRAPELLAAIEAVIKGSGPASVGYTERRPTERTWSVEIAPIPAPQGEAPYFFLVLFQDRSAERRVERIRTDFVANASHELRTPLASMRGFIETLQGPAKDDAAARVRFLAIMHEQAARMSRLIDDLLSLSRIEMKRDVRPEERADLKGVLQEVCEILGPLAEENDVVLEWQPPAEDFVINGDHDELIQVFSNLVENACKYGSSGGRIVLTLAAVQEGGARYFDASVQDFGPGISAEHVPRLTERFYRVDVDASRLKRGTGLGLSIVRNILVRHRARLVVTSKIGEGSTFTARFAR
ncbi:ATP-binding protein [Mangrovibrevibacter kandeliae]|uniref:ATP-binding protein n=1 Tax=Mangrovibrevibacter kandeliae TaxID=2968473 RepID=UPI0021183DB0|nr:MULTISPECIES: ATP-binding protein [unclassified Aurantimonas]MCQ8783234.1 ATP-binding protein [Aurantimonas sp. CSK15Z-1]MCW4116251.1 ATP-binding protein [Aurantimonas sp. MSK8Z-1]